MGFGVVASVLGGAMGFLLEKHYWQICKYCCGATQAGKKLFEQKALMPSHGITCWLHQQTKYERGRIENQTNKQTTWKITARVKIVYHFQAEVSASQGRVQVYSSQGERLERSQNSSWRWNFRSCSQVTRPGWEVLFNFERMVLEVLIYQLVSSYHP